MKKDTFRNYVNVLAIFIMGFMMLLAFPIASADSGHAEYKYLIGTGLLCGLDPSACPTIAMAENGDTIEIAGEGTLSIHPKSATGSGTFAHKDSNGNILATGTWEATELLSFHSYGDGTPQGLPANFEGGLALIRVHLLPDAGGPGFDAIMQVDCLLGKVPGENGKSNGVVEGIRLAVQGGTNFNKEVSGFTLFIKL